MPHLEIPAVPGDQGARTFDLVEGTVAVGRGVGMDLVIIHETLSRRHCELFKAQGGAWAVRDCGSGNGTIVRGYRIDAAVQLEDGDTLVLGSVTITFRDLGADFPTLFGPDDVVDGAELEAVDGLDTLAF